jgi:ADP-heptose:LPS heptosyltransferase
MNIGLMRKVDYWCGIPLATALTLWCWVAGRFRRGTPLAGVRRVLFIELSEMGSAIIVDPVLKRVAERHEVYFLIFERNAASLRIFNTVAEANTCTIRENSFFTLAWDTLRFVAWCRRNRIDAVVDLELFSRVTAILAALSGAPVRIGFHNPHSEGLYRGRILTHPVAYNPHIHIARNFVSLSDPLVHPDRYRDALNRRLIADGEVRLARVQPPEAALEQVRQILRRRIPALARHQRLLLVNANAGDFLPQRKWPQGHFARFVERFLERNAGVLVLLTGSPKERPEVEQIAARVNSPRCINIAGDLKFQELPALYALAEALLTNDSGPAHFASAVGLRTYVLFGPETPALYAPLHNCVPIYAGLACSPCVTAANHRNTPCQDNQCLKTIAPEFVLETIQAYLDGPTPPHGGP